MRSISIAFVLAISALNAAHAGDVYRCTAANGNVMYTNTECPTNSRVQHVASYVAEPPTPPPSADEAAAAAAASAMQAREAALQSKEAAYAARMADLHAQQEASYEPVADRANYVEGGIPYYPGYVAGFRNPRVSHHNHMGDGPPANLPHHPVAPAPRPPMTTPVFRPH